MEVTKLSAQIKNPDRINIFLDGAYAFSLDIAQVVQHKVKVGRHYSSDEIAWLKQEGEFSKYYSRALVYALSRPRSVKEVEDYLYRLTRPKYFVKNGKRLEKVGMAASLIPLIISKLKEKNYLNDEVFANYWVQNRNLSKGVSQRVLTMELKQKGIAQAIIEQVLANGMRNDEEEIRKVIQKRAHRYQDKAKFIKYLLGKGYQYSLIQEVLESENEEGIS